MAAPRPGRMAAPWGNRAGPHHRRELRAGQHRGAGRTVEGWPGTLRGVPARWAGHRLAAARKATVAAGVGRSLRHSAWGTPGPIDNVALRDVLTLAWLRRLSAAAPAASGWASSASALVAARMVLVDHTTPTSRVLDLARPWLGRHWASTSDLGHFRASLPRSAQGILSGIDDPSDLWRVEARLRAEVEADGLRLLHAALPGPDVVLGAIAALAVDGWRLRAALAAADAGSGSSEVLDAVA